MGEFGPWEVLQRLIRVQFVPRDAVPVEQSEEGLAIGRSRERRELEVYGIPRRSERSEEQENNEKDQDETATAAANVEARIPLVLCVPE